MPDLTEVLAELTDEMSAIEDRGAVASYIPELKKVDARKLGIAVHFARRERLYRR